MNGKTITLFFLCVMLLVWSGNSVDSHTVGAADKDALVAKLETDPLKLRAGDTATIFISVTDSHGRPVEGLSMHHERILHVVIASQDFGVFAHVHPEDFGSITPEMMKAARYPVRFAFPEAGRYIVGVDFAKNDQSYSRHFTVDVSGEPKMGKLAKDFARSKRFGNLDVTLSSSPKRITAGKEVVLTYVFERDGNPVTDLEPYLSATMHLAIISGNLSYFMHTHGEVPGMPGMEHAGHHMHMTVPERFGPRIDVRTVFPSRGLYQIYGQIQRGGEVVLTSFMVEVK